MSVARDQTLALVADLARIPAGRRGSVLQAVAAFRPIGELDAAFELGGLRAKLADLWESEFDETIPINDLRHLLEPPVPIGTVLAFSRLNVIDAVPDLAIEMVKLIDHLHMRIVKLRAPIQNRLFESEGESQNCRPAESTPFDGKCVKCLSELVENGCRYSTIYADPPWRYSNTSSRGAAENHYRTMSLKDIAALPICKLAATNSQLHLWTTNGFLREALAVIEAWGFTYKSCFVWVKDDIGMGNYWRVSHEFLCDRSHKNSYVVSVIMWRRPRDHLQTRSNVRRMHHIIFPSRDLESGVGRIWLGGFVVRRREWRPNCAARRENYVAFPRPPTKHFKAFSATTPHNELDHIRIFDVGNSGENHFCGPLTTELG